MTRFEIRPYLKLDHGSSLGDELGKGDERVGLDKADGFGGGGVKLGVALVGQPMHDRWITARKTDSSLKVSLEH